MKNLIVENKKSSTHIAANDTKADPESTDSISIHSQLIITNKHVSILEVKYPSILDKCDANLMHLPAGF